MNENQKKTLKMLRQMCTEIARVRKCAIEAEEFTPEEIDKHIGDYIREAVDRYEDMDVGEFAAELFVDLLIRRLSDG